MLSYKPNMKEHLMSHALDITRRTSQHKT